MNGERRREQVSRNILLCHIGNGLHQMTSSGAPVNGRGRKRSEPGDHLPVVTQSRCHPWSRRYMLNCQAVPQIQIPNAESQPSQTQIPISSKGTGADTKILDHPTPPHHHP